MAELMYGSGLRLTELLRLRIKDVDPDRLRVTVRAGKGDKDRMTVLSAAQSAQSSPTPVGGYRSFVHSFFGQAMTLTW